jgi:hypothetical protein
MDYEEIKTEQLIKILKNDIIPSLDMDDFAQSVFNFREKNWTCMGTYIYLKGSSLSEYDQKELMTLIKEDDDLQDVFQDEVFHRYYDLLNQEVLTWDFSEDEDLKDLEEGSDEYYEAFEDIITNDMDINTPSTMFNLACMEALENYFEGITDTAQEFIDAKVSELKLNDFYTYIYNTDDEDGVDYHTYYDYDKLKFTIQVLMDGSYKEVSEKEFVDILTKKLFVV